jgi:hypothetical protein
VLIIGRPGRSSAWPVVGALYLVVRHGVRRCEAEPAVLAKYVLALLRNDKPEPELRALCEEQLEDFLGEGCTSEGRICPGSHAECSQRN